MLLVLKIKVGYPILSHCSDTVQVELAAGNWGSQPSIVAQNERDFWPFAHGIPPCDFEATKVTVVFRVRAGQTKSVVVAGSFNNWDVQRTPLVKEGDLWRALVMLPRGKHQYRYVVDGVWHSDPTAPESAPNPFESENSI